MNWYFHVLKKYAVFSGRARRKEYWYFILFNTIIIFVFGLIDSDMGTTISPDSRMGLLGGIYTFAMLIPAIAVTVRRLHDTNRSGAWFLVIILPIIGHLILLIFTVQNSKPGRNKYGENPKE